MISCIDISFFLGCFLQRAYMDKEYEEEKNENFKEMYEKMPASLHRHGDYELLCTAG